MTKRQYRSQRDSTEAKETVQKPKRQYRSQRDTPEDKENKTDNRKQRQSETTGRRPTGNLQCASGQHPYSPDGSVGDCSPYSPSSRLSPRRLVSGENSPSNTFSHYYTKLNPQIDKKQRKQMI